MKHSQDQLICIATRKEWNVPIAQENFPEKMLEIDTFEGSIQRCQSLHALSVKGVVKSLTGRKSFNVTLISVEWKKTKNSSVLGLDVQLSFTRKQALEDHIKYDHKKQQDGKGLKRSASYMEEEPAEKKARTVLPDEEKTALGGTHIKSTFLPQSKEERQDLPIFFKDNFQRMKQRLEFAIKERSIWSEMEFICNCSVKTVILLYARRATCNSIIPRWTVHSYLPRGVRGTTSHCWRYD